MNGRLRVAQFALTGQSPAFKTAQQGAMEMRRIAMARGEDG